MDDRYILRAAYDGEYDRAITLLVDIVKKQEKRIKELEERCLQVNTEEPSGQKEN